MALTTAIDQAVIRKARPNPLVKLFDNKLFLIIVCLTPAIGLLMVFLTYPLGLGIWLAFTDTTIGKRGVFVGFENFQYLLTDPLWWNAVFYSIFYTGAATIGKFALGFWLALLLNNHFPLKSLLRAIVLLPWIVPTVLSALAFWWIYDPQFSIISYLLVDVLHIRTTYIDFLGTPWPARFSLIVANIWRGIAGGEPGEGAAIAVSMIPFLVFATLFSYFGLARRKWQQGEAND